MTQILDELRVAKQTFETMSPMEKLTETKLRRDQEDELQKLSIVELLLYRLKEKVMLRAQMGGKYYVVMELFDFAVRSGYQKTITGEISEEALADPAAVTLFKRVKKMGLRPVVMRVIDLGKPIKIMVRW